MPELNTPGVKKSNWRGFTLQLFLITVLPLTALLLVVAFGSQMLHHDAMRNLVGDRDLRTVRAAASSLEREITHLAGTIQIISRSLDGKSDFSALILQPEEISAIFDGGLALYSRTGRLMASSTTQLDWQSIPSLIPETFQSALEDKSQPAFSSLISPAGNSGSFIFVGLLTNRQEMLVGAFSPGRLIENTIGSLVSSGQITVLVISPARTRGDFDVLYRGGPSRADENLPAHPGIREALNGESGINYFQSREGEHVVAYNPVTPTGWGLVIEEAWEDIASPFLNTTQYAPLVLVPVFLLALLTIWFGARRIVTPLQKLEKQAASLAAGDFEAIRLPVGGIEEIRNLQFELVDMADRLKTAQHSLHSYIGAITAGVENERQNLARELHDDTIQALIALNQRIQLSAISINNPHNQATENELRELVQQTMVNLRRIIRGLRPIYLEDLGLVAALGMLGQEVSQSAGLPVDFQVNGAEQRLEPATELAIYRIAQEALNNVVRHANAKHVWMGIDYRSTYLHLSVKDDGKGFVVPDQPGYLAQGGHFGLLGLRERAELINGDLVVSSTPGEGTSVSLRLDYPLKAD